MKYNYCDLNGIKSREILSEEFQLEGKYFYLHFYHFYLKRDHPLLEIQSKFFFTKESSLNFSSVIFRLSCNDGHFFDECQMSTRERESINLRKDCETSSPLALHRLDPFISLANTSFQLELTFRLLYLSTFSGVIYHFV